MSYEMLILLFFIFLAVSAIFSMLGQGGGTFYVPMLLAVSVPFYVAAATSQVLIMVVSLSSMLIFAKARMLDWKLVLLIEPPTNLGSFLGGYLSGDMGVIVKPDEIIITDVENEAAARNVMEWIINFIKDSDGKNRLD